MHRQTQITKRTQAQGEIARAETDARKELTLAEMRAVDELRKALVGANAELRNNPALEDVIARFEGLITVIRSLNTDRKMDEAKMHDLLMRAVMQTVEKQTGVKID